MKITEWTNIYDLIKNSILMLSFVSKEMLVLLQFSNRLEVRINRFYFTILWTEYKIEKNSLNLSFRKKDTKRNIKSKSEKCLSNISEEFIFERDDALPALVDKTVDNQFFGHICPKQNQTILLINFEISALLLTTN